jgi:hypothetical protein
MGRQTGIARGLALAGNITNNREAERRNAEQKTWDRRAYVNNLGIGQMNNAFDGVNNANNQLMNNYNNKAAQKAQEAGGFFGAAGSLAGQYLGGLGGAQAPNIQTSGIPTRNVQPYNRPVPTPSSNNFVNSITGLTSPVVGQSKTPLTLLNMGGY